ncbi:MAG: DUF3427 domain-containing protein [Deltaproteobacteria bacterium]|nr:DUF3427 domain-containing protein [Deltaproteobacteria bacterium]
MPAALAEGLYEHLVTEALAKGLADARAQVSVQGLDAADAHVLLARHVARQIERALLAIPAAERPLAQSELANAFLARIGELSDLDLADEHVAKPPRRLDAVFRAAAPVRPYSPLTSSTLLTRARNDPALGQELAREIASADEIDALVAFITVGGVRALRDALESFANRGGKLRVLSTTFSGTTEVEAIDSLARLPGAEVRISYDVRRTRLHAKAWLFRRKGSGLHTAYVGSANLTSTALGAGQEWMVKVCAADLPHVIEKFAGTFESLWNDPEFEPFTDRDRLLRALHAERAPSADAPAVLFALHPFPFQEEILDRLEAERALHGRTRNLVVAATGTGKTVIAAFDYLRHAQARGVRPRLLFIAHRRELLEQARATFRSVLTDAAFGELWTDGALPERWDHVFATIQSAAPELIDRLGPEHFRYVVVDECHHAPADSYQRIVPQVRPDVLLGLTATPERADGKSLLADFDGRIAAELRLWHALDKQLLVPFEYYGVSDGIDLQRLRWTRTGYVAGELSNLYTGNDARVDLVVGQLQRRVRELRSVRALAFCVSVDHAEYMAAALAKRGVPAIAVHGGTDAATRADAPRQLREREVNVLCTCDLYNEGVDLPFVDTLLLLRPTSSATIFMQQIGRGLRHDHDKTSCLVLDFIGQHRSEFRFDAIYSALTGVPRARIKKDLEEGFPYLPSGCVLQLDQEVGKRVLATLKASLQNRLVADLKELAEERTPTLAEFLEATGREAEDVYRNDGSWTSLQVEAGLIAANDSEDLTRRLGWLLHVDEPTRLRTWTEVIERAATGQPFELTPYERRRLQMLDFQLEHRGVMRIAEETARDLATRPAVRTELRELAAHLHERIALPHDLYPVEGWPLALHRRYSRREIVAAIGFVDAGAKRVTPQAGILKLDDQRREILFVTLDKSASSFSPTTRYRDYAISPSRFHWETQGAAAVDRPSGRRYLDSPGNGWSFYLFVRENPDAPYAFLGPVRYLSHAGDRPIGITWELEHAMPAGLFDRFATLAQG